MRLDLGQHIIMAQDAAASCNSKDSAIDISQKEGKRHRAHFVNATSIGAYKPRTKGPRHSGRKNRYNLPWTDRVVRAQLEKVRRAKKKQALKLRVDSR